MKTICMALLAFICSFPLLAQNQIWKEPLITVPEKTNYQETSTYADVMAFIEVLQKESNLLHLEFMGTSKEGKKIPVLVLANPKVSSPEEAAASGKPVMYVQGNIHAGEVEGKEVVQMLMRDILLGNKKYLLDDQILLFAPIYNSDSNDKMEQGRRPSQEDSPLRVGMRANSQDLDLNRDGIKMEAFETNALLQNVLLKWDPEMLVDLHTTNGTWHGYSLTHAPSYHYAGEKAPYDFTLNILLPTVERAVDEKYNVKIGPYGYYFLSQGWPPKSIATYNHHPRYLVNMMGLRNKVGILSEAFAHERFYQRINSTYAFVAEILAFTNTNGRNMTAINARAEADAIENVINNAGKVEKGVRFKKAPLEKKIEAYRTYDYMTYVDGDGDTRYLRTGRIIEVPDVENYSKFEATVSATLPRAYYLPGSMRFIVDHLKKHGVIVNQVEKSTKVEGEVFVIDRLKRSDRRFEGHFMATVEGTFTQQIKTFKKGDYFIDMAQPLTNLIFYMLEPQSDDGLLNWNFFDEYLESRGANTKKVEYPVFKVYSVE